MPTSSPHGPSVRASTIEINARFPEEMRALLEAEGYSDIEIIRDYKGLYRYAVAFKS